MGINNSNKNMPEKLEITFVPILAYFSPSKNGINELKKVTVSPIKTIGNTNTINKNNNTIT